MPNERHYNELNLESVGINLPYNMQAEQSVLVRVSGTEPKIRVMVEGQDLDAIHRCADRIVDKINKRILGQ